MESTSLRQKVELACSPHLRTEDWGYIMEVVDAINGSNSGPSEACALISEQLQIGNEQVQSITLSLLTACVANCGGRFHDYIGKFKFLNELIKLVSPKYYSDVNPNTKKRILVMIQEWKNTLNQPKINEAYDMLKSEGHEFPIDAANDGIPLNDHNFLEKKQKRRDSFDEGEQQHMLRALLQSKDRDDLAAANALIKAMVDSEDPFEDKCSEKIRADLDTAKNNIDLFDEMLDGYNPDDGSLEDNDVVQELYQFLNKMRPRLKRLCADMEEDEDADGVIPIFRMVDRALDKYEVIIDGRYDPSEDGSHISDSEQATNANTNNTVDDLLLDLSDEPSFTTNTNNTAQPPAGSYLADDDFLALGLGSGLGQGLSAISPNAGSTTGKYDALSDLDALASITLGTPTNAEPLPEQGLSTYSPDLLSGVGGTLSGSPNDLTQVSMSLNDFKASKSPPITAYDQHGLRVLIHKAENVVAPDISTYNISFMNQNGAPINPFSFLAAVPKVMQVRFQAPSSATLPAFDMMMGPRIVSQIMFVKNTQKAPVKLKYRLSFTYEGNEFADQGQLCL
eukprot:CFRG0583T1